jgi:hypothetical protein
MTHRERPLAAPGGWTNRCVVNSFATESTSTFTIAILSDGLSNFPVHVSICSDQCRVGVRRLDVGAQCGFEHDKSNV